MSEGNVGADLTGLAKDHFGPFMDHMNNVYRTFQAAHPDQVSATVPKVRAKLDKQVAEVVSDSAQVSLDVLEGLVKLPEGDKGRVDGLTEMLTKAESDATDASDAAWHTDVKHGH